MYTDWQKQLPLKAKHCADELIRTNNTVFMFLLLQGYIDDNGNLNDEIGLQYGFYFICEAYEALQTGKASGQLYNQWRDIVEQYDDNSWSGYMYGQWMRMVQKHLITHCLQRTPKVVFGGEVAWSELQLKAREIQNHVI